MEKKNTADVSWGTSDQDLSSIGSFASGLETLLGIFLGTKSYAKEAQAFTGLHVSSNVSSTELSWRRAATLPKLHGIADFPVLPTLL